MHKTRAHMRCGLGEYCTWQSARARTCVQRWHTHLLRSARCCEQAWLHGNSGTTHTCQHYTAAEQQCTRRGRTCAVGLANTARGRAQWREHVCKGGTLTNCDRPDVASRHGCTAAAAQRTHASIILQLSGSAQDAGAHVLWAWRILHVAERIGANVCAKVALSRAAIGQMLRAGTAAW